MCWAALIVVVAITVTVRKNPTRFLEFSNSVVTMTPEQYQQLFPLLKRKVNERLKWMNFELKKKGFWK